MCGLTHGTPVNVQAKVQARKSGAATPSTDLLLKRSLAGAGTSTQKGTHRAFLDGTGWLC